MSFYVDTAEYIIPPILKMEKPSKKYFIDKLERKDL